MAIRFFTPTEIESRYALLKVMMEELGGAFEGAGCSWNAAGAVGPADLSIYSLFNFPERARDALAWANLARPRTAMVHLFVDHPFAMDDRQMDELSRAGGYRLVLPCADETSLMPMRWPSLKFVRMPHAVSPGALCEASGVEREQSAGVRGYDLVAAGTIPTEGELEQRRAAVPATARRACEEIIELMAEHAWMGFTQACDVAVGSGMGGADQWRLLKIMWRYVTDAVNRRRRVGLLGAMQGIRTAVFGPEVWREFCTGTIEYRGEVGYDGVAGAMRCGRVCLAWNPTQFVHSWSERVLLAMGAGCAAVTDDRVLVRRELGDAVETFDAGTPGTARAAVERLLGDESARTALAVRGRRAVEAGHLWSHRVPGLIAVAAGAAGVQMGAKAA